MPIKVKQRITAWSFSRFKDYIKCAFYAYCKHVLKHKEPEGPAMAVGSRVHELAAQAVQPANKKKPLVRELSAFKPEFDALRKSGVQVLCEQEWAFDADWKPVSWFAKQAWVRIKMDAHWLEQTASKMKPGRAGVKAFSMRETTVHVVDYKTGKIYEDDHALQRSLYAVGALLMYPDAVEVVVAHWYLDLGEERTETFTAGQLPALQKQWLASTKKMLADTTFKPEPGNHCRWCYLSKARGGPCVF